MDDRSYFETAVIRAIGGGRNLHSSGGLNRLFAEKRYLTFGSYCGALRMAQMSILWL